MSHRKLSVAELLAQLSHYNADVRCDALKGLAELLGRGPPEAAWLRELLRCAAARIERPWLQKKAEGAWDVARSSPMGWASAVSRRRR